MKKLLLSLREDKWGYCFMTLNTGSREITIAIDSKYGREIREAVKIPENTNKLEEREAIINLKRYLDRYSLLISNTEDSPYTLQLRDDMAERLLSFGIEVAEQTINS